jgi:hypothetical protein
MQKNKEEPMTCRDEILDCTRQITANKGENFFSIQDILDNMHQMHTRYEDSTIRTHITSRMCANAPQNHAVKYNDLERIGHGLYKLRLE